MSLRVGYVNVQGLSSDNWESACSLLGNTFDYLFLAETWYVHHKTHLRDRRLIASTPHRTDKYRAGRPSGGIYLIGTSDARSRIKEDPTVSDETITFVVGKQTISGVYFAPSMSVRALERSLNSVKDSTVILGDINTRFPNRDYQSGQAGPPERVVLFSSFLQSSRLQHFKPSAGQLVAGARLEQLLTVDHCFVKRATDGTRLYLVNNSSIHIKTDHRYTLYLTLCNSTDNRDTTMSAEMPRYQISRLSDPDVQKSINQQCEAYIKDSPVLFDMQDIDKINATLVKICQEVCRSTLGIKKMQPNHANPKNRLKPKPKPKHNPADEQSAEASIRLYKQTAVFSKENGVIVPTESARLRGVDAVTENYQILRDRYTSLRQSQPPKKATHTIYPDSSLLFSQDDIIKEIKHQGSSKACGADGIQIRLLKVLANTRFISLLQHLYNCCIQTGNTPRVWNETEIYMLVKDIDKPRDARNLRPITLIRMFRKVFERLLLARFDGKGWARLHPAQAGFRSHYSTCTNAAIVHYLLSSKSRSTAVFLDFRSAFDVVDHGLLTDVLQQRHCPQYIQSLIRSLMFRQVRSRVLVNDRVSKWFKRTRGVLQGSPLSPYLFNMFIDSFLYRLNTDPAKPPFCLFYADDGVISLHLQLTRRLC